MRKAGRGRAAPGARTKFPTNGQHSAQVRTDEAAAEIVAVPLDGTNGGDHWVCFPASAVRHADFETVVDAIDTAFGSTSRQYVVGLGSRHTLTLDFLPGTVQVIKMPRGATPAEAVTEYRRQQQTVSIAP